MSPTPVDSEGGAATREDTSDPVGAYRAGRLARSQAAHDRTQPVLRRAPASSGAPPSVHAATAWIRSPEPSARAPPIMPRGRRVQPGRAALPCRAGEFAKAHHAGFAEGPVRSICREDEGFHAAYALAVKTGHREGLGKTQARVERHCEVVARLAQPAVGHHDAASLRLARRQAARRAPLLKECRASWRSVPQRMQVGEPSRTRRCWFAPMPGVSKSRFRSDAFRSQSQRAYRSPVAPDLNGLATKGGSKRFHASSRESGNRPVIQLLVD